MKRDVNNGTSNGVNSIDEKLNLIVKAEKQALLRTADVENEARELMKEAAVEKEKILDEAVLQAYSAKEKTLAAKKQQAREEVRKIVVDAEIEAGKLSHRLKARKEKVFDYLFKELESYIK